MKTLRVYKAKPNPTGKDKTRGGQASAAQLAGEWVDIQNTGNVGVELNGINLCHKAYKPDGTWEWEVVCSLPTMTLGSGEILRVHSGKGPLSEVRAEDQVGCHWHYFTQRDNYIWNNDRGDEPLLYFVPDKVTIDSAAYDANPPEGVVLQRVGNKLVPAGVSSYR
jgi:hypothetical protein